MKNTTAKANRCLQASIAALFIMIKKAIKGE